MAAMTTIKFDQFLGNSWKTQQPTVTRKIITVGSPPNVQQKKRFTVKAAVGELTPDSTTYLIAGAGAVALLGTAFPIIFSRKDMCPECDGAGFVRKSGSALRANAARKDQAQIVCANCNGLGKLNQVDK